MPYFVLFLILLNSFFPAYACQNSDDEPSYDEKYALFDNEIVMRPSLNSLKKVQAFLERKDLSRIRGIRLGSHKNSFQLEDLFFQKIAEVCPHLTELDCCKYPFPDLSFLKYFPKITSLILSHSKATDFSPLSGLLKLEELNLFRCSFFGDDQIAPLEHLTNSMRELIIGHNALTEKGVGRLRDLFKGKLRHIGL